MLCEIFYLYFLILIHNKRNIDIFQNRPISNNNNNASKANIVNQKNENNFK